MKHREHRPAPSPQTESRRDQTVAPGKRTLTMGLAARQPAGAAPLQRRSATAQSTPPRSRVAEGPVEDWTAVALRPDLHQAPIMRKSASEIGYAGAAARSAPPSSSGRAMPATVQAKMERAFGADFSAVRVHEGPEAQSMGALAYAQGSDLHFAPGQYEPDSPRGQELLGHELAHVVQQAQGRVTATTQAKGMGVNDDARLEREADQMGARAARGEPAGMGPMASAPGASSHAPIQGRFPARHYKEGLLGAEPRNQAANLQGIQNLLIRFYTRDLDDGGRTAVQDRCRTYHIDLDKALYQAPSDHTHHLYNLVVNDIPQAVYPGHNLPIAPQDHVQGGHLATLVHQATAVLDWMCSDASARDFLAVFGDGAGGAQIRTSRARNTLETLAGEARIGTDRSGEHAEMMIGAHASFGSNILLQQGAFNGPPTAELVATLIHETFHVANGDVLDDGGYPSNPVDFRQRSVGEKVLNASHYEEVARRHLGASPLGGEFRPAQRVEHDESGNRVIIDTRTPAQRAVAQARSRAQLAWERGQNVHGLLKVQLGAPRNEYWPPILAWSHVLHLQIHEREPNHRDHGMNINYVDLLQVESLTKTLGQMMREPLEPFLADVPDSAPEDAIVTWLLQQLATRFADTRWLTADRLLAIVDVLHRAPRDVSTFHL